MRNPFKKPTPKPASVDTRHTEHRARQHARTQAIHALTTYQQQLDGTRRLGTRRANRHRAEGIRTAISIIRAIHTSDTPPNTTGTSSGPHLHFETRDWSKPIGAPIASSFTHWPHTTKGKNT